MNIYTWSIFISSISVLSAIPGPNMIFILNTSINKTFRETLISTTGCLFGVLISIITCCFIVIFLSNIQQQFINVINILGVIYLFILGVKYIKNEPRSSKNEETYLSKINNNLFIEGFLISSCNPKTILFIISFFPQFIDMKSPLLPQYSILIISFIICETFWMFAYIYGGNKAKEIIENPKVFIFINKIIGVFFILFSISLLTLNLT